LLRDVVGFRGRLRFDASKSDGMPLKSLDSTELFSWGWRPETVLSDGLRATYEWLLREGMAIRV
jgi:GDP-L-fucose synthase